MNSSLRFRNTYPEILESAPRRGLLYRNHGYLEVNGYSATDWAASLMDERSTTRYCLYVGGNLVSWKSKKQHVLPRLSPEV